VVPLKLNPVYGYGFGESFVESELSAVDATAVWLIVANNEEGTPLLHAANEEKRLRYTCPFETDAVWLWFGFANTGVVGGGDPNKFIVEVEVSNDEIDGEERERP